MKENKLNNYLCFSQILLVVFDKINILIFTEFVLHC